VTAAIRAGRVTLRPWRASDLAPFAAMSADAEVMRHFPSTLTQEEAAAFIARAERHQAAHGFCFWAAETLDAPFIGAVGLARVTFDAGFAGAVEIGWRLARPFWGQGLATEAARAALDHGFSVLRPPEIVAFTALSNTPSMRVMERLGMTRVRTFDHPRLPPDHPLRRHVLYRLEAP
jgi:RimJ/RimL family protein N-acetyltransferase